MFLKYCDAVQTNQMQKLLGVISEHVLRGSDKVTLRSHLWKNVPPGEQSVRLSDFLQISEFIKD